MDQKKYYHDCIGHNYRMDGIQGAILEIKLKHLPLWTQKRQERAAWYREKIIRYTIHRTTKRNG